MLYETYSGNIGTTIRHEYLPREMVPRPFVSGVQLNGSQKPAPLALEGALTGARLIRRSATSETWELEAATPSLLAFHTTFYPGWEATVDGVAQGVEPLEGLGLVGLRLGPGTHRVKLRLTRTPAGRYALWTSIVAALFWLILVLYPCRRSARYRRGMLLMAIGLVAFGLQMIVAPKTPAKPSAAQGLLVMDFSRAPYLHSEPEAILLGDTLLLDYALSSATINPGEELAITFHWQWSRQPHQVQVALVGATAHLFPPAPAWVQATEAITLSYTTLRLRLPENIAPGIYVPQLNILRNGQPQTPYTALGMPMGTLALAPVQVLSSRRATGQEAVLGHFGPERALPVIDLVGVETTRPSKGMLEIALTWRSQRQAPLNYMLSLRLYRPDGSKVTSRDIPPLLGGYPTSLWIPGELVTDRVLLTLPEGEAASGDYRLEIVLYDRVTLQAVGTTTTSLPL